MTQLRTNRAWKECRKKENASIVQMKQFYPSHCLFLVLDKSLCYKTESSNCNVVTVLNSLPPEMYQTGRRVKQRALQGMNVISSAAVCSRFFLSVSFSSHPHSSPLFCSNSLLRFSLSLAQQCPSSGSLPTRIPVPRCNLHCFNCCMLISSHVLLSFRLSVY